MAYMRSEGERAKQATAAFHTWHSARTYNPGHPQIDPWMRGVLVSLQETLYTLADVSQKLAEESDRQSRRLDQIERFLSQLPSQR